MTVDLEILIQSKDNSLGTAFVLEMLLLNKTKQKPLDLTNSIYLLVLWEFPMQMLIEISD